MMANKKLFEHIARIKVGKKQDLLKQLDVTSCSEVTLKALHTLLSSEQASSDVKVTACSLLADISNKKSTGVLLEAFNDKDEDLSHMAMLAILNIESDRVLEFMVDTLQHSPNKNKRRDAAYVLSVYVGNDRAIDSLIGKLSDKNESSEVRAQAAESLGVLTATRAADTLVANLHDRSLEVRFWCVYALCQAGMDPAIIPELEKFFGDKSKVGIWTIGEEANKAIMFIKARAAALEDYKGNKSTVDVWDIQTETLKLVEEMK